VGLTVFQVLDKAVEAGGENLSGKDIAGTNKEAKGVLDEACSAGLLTKTGARSPKFSLTAQGRATWEQQVSPERRQQLRARKEEEKRRALAGFLGVVRDKPDKALTTKKELERYPSSLRQDAVARRLVEPGSKPNSYRLLPAGDEVLLAEEPIEQQLDRLRQLQREASGRWAAAHQRLRQDLEGGGWPAVQAAAAELADRGRQACVAFDQAVAELGAFPVLITAARQLRADAEAAYGQAVQRLESEKARLAELEAGLKATAEQIEAVERRAEKCLRELASRVTSPPAQQGSSPSDAAVWEVARRACEELRQETARLGGIIKVPDLTDKVRQAFPDLTPPTVHDLLRKWQQEDRLTLQLCNDPRLEPRANEGIHSPRGLLFYIQVR
jgi:hypothetical protein